MRAFRIVWRVVLFVVVAAMLNYVLPQRDIVQISQVETKRTDFGAINKWFYASADSGNTDQVNRDIYYIFADRKKTTLFGMIRRDATGVIVYRNEDTGWIWPPYFKFDSSNLQAEAASLARRDANSEGGNWAVVTHYGWRIPFLSIFPNAVSVRPVDGPDVQLIPWFNIIFLAFFLAAVLLGRSMWLQLRERTIDPILDRAGHRLDEAQAGVAERRSRAGRWFRRLGSKKS